MEDMNTPEWHQDADMPEIPAKQDILDKAFGRASKKADAVEMKGDRLRAVREKEAIRIGVSSDVIISSLSEVVDETFSYDRLSPFHHDLVAALIDIDEFKQALGSVNWAADEVKSLRKMYGGRLRNAKDFDRMDEIRKSFYGEASATVDKVSSELEYLRECKEKLSEMPDLKDVQTVVIAGMPNVGKSTLLRALTGSEPDVQAYPFTTKGLMVGYAEGPYGEIQVVDTPGVLDRPIKERNTIEKQAVTALKNVADVIIYLYDPTDSAYPVEEQEALFREIKAKYKLPIMEVYNKADVRRVEGETCISAETGEGVDELWENVLETLRRSS